MFFSIAESGSGGGGSIVMTDGSDSSDNANDGGQFFSQAAHQIRVMEVHYLSMED